MRILIAIILSNICPNILGQESFRTFNEVNPALENLQYDNVVFRSIQNEDAVFNYFHFHTNRISRKFITGIDITTKSLDIREADAITTVLKTHYNFRITRGLSIAAGLGIGATSSNKVINGILIPGLAIVSRKFSFGYNSILNQVNSGTLWKHSVQGLFSFKIPYKKKSNSIKESETNDKNLLLNVSYLNFWEQSIITNQYLVAQVKLNKLTTSFGVNNLNTNEFNPLLGLGVSAPNISISFQTVFNQDEILEMQVSVKHTFSRFIRKRMPFRIMTMPDF